MLSSSEVERVSGGFGFEADDGPPIVVDGRRYTGLTVDQLLGLIDDGAFDGYVDGTGDLGGGSGDDGPPPEEECSDHGDGDGENEPRNALNGAIMALVRQVTGILGEGISGPPNPKTSPSGKDDTEA